MPSPTFIDRLRSVRFYRLLLFLFGWGLLGPFAVFVGGLILAAATGATDQQGQYLAILWTFCVLAWFVAACRKKLGY